MLLISHVLLKNMERKYKYEYKASTQNPTVVLKREIIPNCQAGNSY